MNDILNKLGISGTSYGACIGGKKWLESSDSGIVESLNPSNNNVIGEVYLCSESDYDIVIQESQKTFNDWRISTTIM